MFQTHSRLIEVHAAHGTELGLTKTFEAVRQRQAELLQSTEFDSLLIVGPGDGDEAEALFSKLGRDPGSCRIIACDLNAARMQAFQQRFPQAQGFVGDILSSAFQDYMRMHTPVSVVQMSFVLHDHTEAQKPQLLKLLKGLLHAGGTLITADPTLPHYPNYLPAIPDQEALAEVKAGLTRYYQTYIDEIKEWTNLKPERKMALLQSLDKGLADALRHEDGREAFDTPSLYEQRFVAAGFSNILMQAVFNSVYVVQAIT